MKYNHTNTTDHYQYPLGRALPPGETVELDSDECPEFLNPDDAAPPTKTAGDDDDGPEPDLALKAVLDQTAKDIIAEIDAAPADALTDADLKRLEELESAAKDPRKTVLAHITETLLKRAEAAGGQ